MENYDQLLAYLCTRLEHFDNDCVTFLRKHSKKYVETEQKMNEILEHTAIKNFLINEDSIYLTEEEHKLFIRYMGLENYLYTLENAVIYLLGCHDTTILQSIFHEFKMKKNQCFKKQKNNKRKITSEKTFVIFQFYGGVYDKTYQTKGFSRNKKDRSVDLFRQLSTRSIKENIT